MPQLCFELGSSKIRCLFATRADVPRGLAELPLRTFPIRCTAAIMSVTRGTCTVAARHPGCVLVDPRRTFLLTAALSCNVPPQVTSGLPATLLFADADAGPLFNAELVARRRPNW